MAFSFRLEKLNKINFKAREINHKHIAIAVISLINFYKI